MSTSPGNLALTQDAIELFQKKHPELIAKINFTKAPAPELPGKLKAMQGAGRSDIDLVMTGTDFLAAGIEQGVLMKVLPDNAAKFPNLTANYLPAAAKMQELAQDYGVAVTFMPAGPLMEYNPDKVKQVPTTPAELLAWCKANPNKLIYARPANSGPGRTFIMGLPYILGDSNPKDPVKGWDKTWAYLKELNTLHRVLPDGHRRGDEGTGRRLARHDDDDDRLGYQSACAWHRAEELQSAAIQRHDLGQRRALHDDPEGCAAGESRGRARPDGVPADTGSAGLHVGQGLLLSRARR